MSQKYWKIKIFTIEIFRNIFLKSEDYFITNILPNNEYSFLSLSLSAKFKLCS